MRSNQHKRIPADVRFWTFVDKNGPVPEHAKHLGQCWVWTGKRSRYGYGLLSMSHTTSVAAHRFSYELANGPLTPGNDCCHACDNRACVRPSHLFDGTRSQNLQDGADKGLFTCGERNGQTKLTDAQVTEIRAKHAAGGVFHHDLAAEYGVSRPLITYILNGKSRKHLLRRSA
jgi:hypothetical protein